MVYFDLPPHPSLAESPAVEVVENASRSTSSWIAQTQPAQTQPDVHLSFVSAPSSPDHLLDQLLAAAQEQTSRSTDEIVADGKDLAQTEDLPSLEQAPGNAEETSPDADSDAQPVQVAPVLPAPVFSMPVSPASSPPASSPPASNQTEPVPSEPIPSDPAQATPIPPAPVPSDSDQTDSDQNAPAADDGLTPEAFASQLRLTADYQAYDPTTQIITAQGNVLLVLNDAIIEADELWLNLVNRYALADGNVLLTRGAQIVRGSQAEYNFIQQSGKVSNAVGTLYRPEIAGDLRSPLEAPSQTAPTATRRAYDPINSQLRVVGDGSVQIATSPDAETTSGSDGSLRQLRFETDELTFDVEGWRASAVRITNDPFSPPELELRTDSLWLRNLSPTQDELLLKRPRLVFDQGLSLPLLRSRILLSRGTVNPEDLNPVPATIGIDGSERGGFYLGRQIPVVTTDRARFSVTPQFLLAKALSGESGSFISLDNFGAEADLSAQLGPRTNLTGRVELTSLNFNNITERLRTNVRAEQLIGDHRLAVQYSYRERLFNGSLGFQDVQSSFGAVLLSPDIQLGENGPTLSYQASAQLINAQSDREDLRAESGRATLGRFQASAALRRNFTLWRGEPKPPTQNEGLRFTPEPVVPYLELTTGLRATGTYYSSGDFQDNLVAEVGLEGQLGHFSRNFGDYTRFNIGYSQSFIGGANSPFLFDREVDRNILSLGLTQQIYGPFLVGFQTALSFSEDRAINTFYTLEYSRRTYGILLRYDTTQNTGSIGFRLSNFSWLGDSDPFDTPRVRAVEGGVIEQP